MSTPSPLLEIKDHWLAEFERVAKALPGPAKARREAVERFGAAGFPTGREEEWRFTDVTPVAETPFRSPEGAADLKSVEAVAHGPLKDCQIAFVDGRHAPGFSTLRLPPGVTVERLREAGVADGNAFAVLNAAFWGDGAFVRIARGVRVERPIHLLFLSTKRAEPFAAHPRIVVHAEANSSAAVVESFLGPAGGVYLTNAVTDVRVDDHASVDYYKVQRESHEAYHFATLRVREGRGSVFQHHSISFGALLARNDFATVLDGEGAECALRGLYEVTGRQLVDHHTTIDHASPHGTSREMYKGILDGRSKAVFDGSIVVRPDAQKTNAHQTNKNLLLSKQALVHTKPQLEIFANDVKCKHGATIGQLDEDVLFYLRSRGIGLAEARRLLIHAFASEIVDGVKLDAVRAQLGGCLLIMVR